MVLSCVRALLCVMEFNCVTVIAVKRVTCIIVLAWACVIVLTPDELGRGPHSLNACRT